MNSTVGVFDIYSTFSYDDVKKYFENLKCNSDSDCPEKASCVSNKCITKFYCKKDDPLTCALFKNICNGKLCYKYDNPCDKNEDCFSGLCEYHNCQNESFDYGVLVNEYSTSFFSYEDAKNHFNNLNVKCRSSKDCPNNSYCLNSDFNIEVKTSYSCDNCFDSCESLFYCKKNKSVCSFNKDEKNGIIYSSLISANYSAFGLSDGEKCRYDSECILHRCLPKGYIRKGYCEGTDTDYIYSDLPYALFFMFIFCPFLIAEIFLVFFLIAFYGMNLQRKKKGLEKKKYSKRIVYSTIIIGIFIISYIAFYALREIGIYLYNEKPL